MLGKIITSITVGFLGGVFIHSVFLESNIQIEYFMISIMFGAVCMLIYKHRWLVYVTFLLCGLVFGILRFAETIDQPGSFALDQFVESNQKYSVRGDIVSDPDYGINQTQFVFETREIFDGSDWQTVQTRLLVTTSSYFQYGYGDYVEIHGKIERPESFETDTGRVFDYEHYLAKDNLFYVMRYAEVIVLDSEQGSSIRSGLYTLKHRLLGGIERFIPRPESGLLAGILFGEKSRLSDDIEDQFRIVGLMHIVVLSGYNVSIVIYALMFLLRWIPLPIRSLLAVLGIVAFAIITGAGPTVVRASIMAMFIVIAKLAGRQYNVGRALLIAGFFMILWNPRILYFDISFQLSFLATYGLIIFSSILEKKLAWLPSWFMIRESAVATISAQLFVLPLIIYAIGEFSVISIIVNILVLFAVPIAMFFGFLVALFSNMVPAIASLFALPTTILLKYQLWIVEIFSRLSFAQITFPPFHWSIMLLLYGLLFWYLYRNTMTRSHREL